MNPGTYYLYEYNASKRRRNVGFIKVTRRYQSCIFQIHARGIPADDGTPLSFSVFCHEQDMFLRSQAALLTCYRRGISARLSVPEREFPQGRPLEQIDGFLIMLPQQETNLFWMASACFFEITPEMLKEPESGAEPPEAEEEPVVSETPQQEEEPVVPETPQQETDTVLQTSEASPEVQAKKIRRSDLSLLPGKFWPLANNSFLLHGYHNYNHLLLLEEAGRLWLGVPGIYDPREARAADLFGFPRFTREGAALIDLDKEERSQSPDFGHWCRCVGTSRNACDDRERLR